MASNERGFSILEMTVAITIMLGVTAGVFALLLPSHGMTAAQPEAADMQQRLRVAVDAITRDLIGAGAIRPYRAGPVRPDAPDTFKSNTITVFTMALVPGGAQSATYWQEDDASGSYQLMFYDGSASGADVPVVDHFVRLQFEYWGDPQPPARTAPLTEESCLFAAGDPPTPKLPILGNGGPALVKLTAAMLTDGPWCPDDSAPDRWDADLVRIRRVGVTVRVEAAVASLRGPASALFLHAGTSRGGHAWVPDLEARFDVAPRNVNLAR